MKKKPNAFNYKLFLKQLPHRPGVYQMLSETGQVLYVGKARDLKNRVSSYFTKSQQSPKTSILLKQVGSIEIFITQNDVEALLLESNLIKQLKPRYNVLLRDDKSYPYLYLSDHLFPSLKFYRGARAKRGRYFGPYPSTHAVRKTLNLLQKIFKIRQCEDSFFSHRSRPCLQYQIKRCTAPCVGYISKEEYAQDIEDVMLFLKGKDQRLVKQLKHRMEKASSEQDYELAAKIRDQIASITGLQQEQVMSREGADTDVIAIATVGKQACIQLVLIRQGRVLGNKSFYFKLPEGTESQEALESFITQYYLSSKVEKNIPHFIFVNQTLSDKHWLEEAFQEQFKQKIQITKPTRGVRKTWLELANKNVEQTLASHVANHMHILEQFKKLQSALFLPMLPTRMECFDISHTMGEATVASCVVFDQNGPLKREYRRFNIKNIQLGDDYAAMKQALERRYLKLKEHEKILPELLIIDGGKGQLTQALAVLEELQLSDMVVLAVAKGVTRKPGMERLFLARPQKAVSEVSLDESSLHLIQHIRDEAHRFAISGHRKQRAQKRSHSELESIPGIGAKRRRELLKHFGGMQGLKDASINDLSKVPGISLSTAKKIYQFLHDGDLK